MWINVRLTINMSVNENITINITINYNKCKIYLKKKKTNKHAQKRENEVLIKKQTTNLLLTCHNFLKGKNHMINFK